MTAHFPAVRGRTLLGQDVELPSGLPAERTLAVLAFRQSHQACVDRWIAGAVERGVPDSPIDLPSDTPVAVIEIPVLSTRWNLGRRFIDGGMAANIRDRRVLARTITVYTDVRALQEPLLIEGSDDVVPLVVTRDGRVLARSTGEPSPASWTPLMRALGLR